jgi:phosphatidylglycerol:prolipoprotein diacylglycerol transferase
MSDQTAAQIGFPRYFNICGSWINSYKVCLCVGIYVGSLATAALADYSGLSPSRVGFGAMVCALSGLFGARVYHLLVHAPVYFGQRPRRALWDSKRGGWSVFGALLTFIPASFGVAAMLHLPTTMFWDYMGIGVLAGGFWIRLGCVFNGCCAGRETQGFVGLRLHDTLGAQKRRVPVQFLEMAWWLLGGFAFLWLWPRPLSHGSYALGVLGWYGVGRFFLEPLRERPDIVLGTVRINQVVAGLVALAAAGALVIHAWQT